MPNYTKIIKVTLLTGTLLALFACSDTDKLSHSSDTKEQLLAKEQKVELTLHKSPTCGCCKKWAEHIKENNFKIINKNNNNLTKLKIDKGIAPRYQSCHTAVSKGGFVFEGHIPAKFIEQFLENPPVDAIGLSVPGMPLGSPGMSAGDNFMEYEVLQLNSDGSATLFAKVTNIKEQY